MTTLLEALQEATPEGQMRLGVPDREKLQQAIYKRLVREYERQARAVQKDLGGDGKFKLEAAWKQRELLQKARVMARATTKTTRARLAEIAKLPPGQRGARKKEWLEFKAMQLEELVGAEGRFQAQVDMLAHSGVADVDKARVMYFRTVGVDPPRSPCPICTGIAAGNPYTIRQATTLGSKAHPGCKDHWDEQWQADEAMRANVRRQVRDGEVRLWDGKARTPARGRASDKQAKMQAAKGGWKGRRTYQKRTITQRSA